MFEQSILTAQPQKRTWFLVLSLITQTFLITTGVIIPLIYTDQLPGLSKWAQRLVLPSPPPAAPPASEKPVVQRQATLETKVFRVPSESPDHVLNLKENPNDRIIEIPEAGVIGSTLPEGSSVGNTFAQLLTSAVPVPKPPPVVSPKPTPVTHEPLRVSSTVQEAKLLRKIIPIYPPLAITTHTQGPVHLVGVIAKDGTIQNLHVIDGHPLLIRAAVDAVKQWVYRPTILNNEPVEVIAPITVTFTLNR